MSSIFHYYVKRGVIAKSSVELYYVGVLDSRHNLNFPKYCLYLFTGVSKTNTLNSYGKLGQKLVIS